MKKIVLIIAVNFLFICCVSNRKNDSKCIYYNKVSIDNELKKTKYKMFIPKGFFLEKEDFNNEYKEVRYLYDKNIIIYITDNAIGGSGLNGDNKLDAGIEVIYRKSLNDSIYLFGKQKDNRYWKENILNDIVVGYLNVPEERKNEFDRALQSLTIK